jgi:hypothetical protein
MLSLMAGRPCQFDVDAWGEPAANEEHDMYHNLVGTGAWSGPAAFLLLRLHIRLYTARKQVKRKPGLRSYFTKHPSVTVTDDFRCVTGATIQIDRDDEGGDWDMDLGPVAEPTFDSLLHVIENPSFATRWT